MLEVDEWIRNDVDHVYLALRSEIPRCTGMRCGYGRRMTRQNLGSDPASAPSDVGLAAFPAGVPARIGRSHRRGNSPFIRARPASEDTQRELRSRPLGVQFQLSPEIEAHPIIWLH